MWSLLLLSGALAACSPPEVSSAAATAPEKARQILDRGDSATAVGLYEAAAEAARQGEDPATEVEALVGLGVARQRQRQWPEAEKAFRRAMALAEGAGDEARACVAHNRLGMLFRDQDKVEEAARAHREALPLCEAAGDAHEQAGGLNELGLACYKLGRGQQAELAYRHAAALAAREGFGDLEALVAYNRGNLEYWLGRFSAARAHLLWALERFERLPGQEAKQVQTLLVLGRLERQAIPQGRALELLARARTLAGRLGSPSLEAAVLHTLGVEQREQANLAEAKVSLLAAATRRQTLGEHDRESLSAGELGETLRQSGELAAARQWLEVAKSAAERAQDPVLEAFTLARSSRVLRDSGDAEAAEAEMRRAIDLFESANRTVDDPDARATQLAFRRGYYDEHVDLLMQLGRRAAALEASERARARGLLGLLAEAQVDVESGVAPELKERERQLEKRRSVAQALWLSKRGAGAPRAEIVALRGDLERLEEERTRLASEIRESNSRYAQVQYPEPLGLSQIEKRLALGKGSALLEYALGEERAYLFLLRRSGLETYDLGRTEDLRRRVKAALEALLEDETTPEQYAILASELYQSLIPAQAVAALAKAERLIVVPDDALFSFPFEALVTESTTDGPRYLVERWTVSYAPSATVLAQLGAEPVRARPDAGQPVFVGFADPSYPKPAPSAGMAPAAAGPERGLFDRDGRLSLLKLPASRDEVESIAGLFAPRPTSVYLGPEAREENVKGNPQIQGAQYLHFAVHAFTDETDPDRFGLVLSQGLPSEEDGVLQLGEIFNLQLDADLVVLSACSSGLGLPIKGEGFVGLTRAFFYAGARSLLASLWNVHDVPSAALMKRFYSHLLAEGDAAEALRQAKLDLLREGVHTRPEDWAGFVLTGVSR